MKLRSSRDENSLQLHPSIDKSKMFTEIIIHWNWSNRNALNLEVLSFYTIFKGQFSVKNNSLGWVPAKQVVTPFLEFYMDENYIIT